MIGGARHLRDFDQNCIAKDDDDVGLLLNIVAQGNVGVVRDVDTSS